MASVRQVTRQLVSTFLTAAIIAALGLQAGARQTLGLHATISDPLTAQDVVSNLSARNATLSTFQAHVDIRLHTGIPFLNPTFEGMTYFKQPDRHEVVFTKSPSYAKGFEQLYSDVS